MSSAVAGSIEAVRQAVASARGRGQSVGLVPTMGALHAGHASLIRAARDETAFVIVSIFVNPTQFGPTEDLSRYPRPLERDLELCDREQVDLVFLPQAAEIYPADFRTFVEVSELQDVLCGASRPGHFRGVATVVLKLFNIVEPDVAYFGQKDAQQAAIIRQMVSDLNVPVRLRVCPIVREPDGLAVSSRNQYLDADQRRAAPVLFRALEEARLLIASGVRDAATVRQAMAAPIKATPGAVVDYAEVVDAGTLGPVQRLGGDILLAVAAKFGATRLIDNVQLTVKA
ncbi:MAG TPA: pantoate--beta-alanine ligase [Gemmataceae bacterium]|jgi:pantoate--beta-alanine ligase|nr:pantoate--beta-alanine ligase [Gemmataceae bacterium]